MKKIFIFLLPLSMCLVAATCKQSANGSTTNTTQTDAGCVEKQGDGCMCTEIYKPVCGCNGKTYGNECSAKCNGITKFTEGECPKKN
jgi:Kazal-type serine protease inhibitor domain